MVRLAWGMILRVLPCAKDWPVGNKSAAVRTIEVDSAVRRERRLKDVFIRVSFRAQMTRVSENQREL